MDDGQLQIQHSKALIKTLVVVDDVNCAPVLTGTTRKIKRKPINAMKCKLSSKISRDTTKIANILNSHFATTGQRLAAKSPHSEKHFSDYFSSESINKPANFFAFYNVEPTEVMLDIFDLPLNKSQGLYSCPIRMAKLMYNASNNAPPQSLQDLFKKTREIHDTRSVSAGNFYTHHLQFW